MKWQAKPKSLKPRYYEIKEDPSVGVYLYVFEDDKCIYDHLQDTFEIALESALKDYGVPKNAWKQFEDQKNLSS